MDGFSAASSVAAHATASSRPLPRPSGPWPITWPFGSVKARQNAWEGFLTGRDDRDQIILALADVDPTGPPPEPGADDDEAVPRPRFQLTCAADITPRPVEWLWRDRVPRGMLSLFAGDPKLGKSLVTIATAAAGSRGAALPGDNPPDGPGSVILLSAEDDPARTIVPRLIAAGADRNRVHLLESVDCGDGIEAPPNLRADIDKIEDAVASRDDCRLIVIDPVSASRAGTDDHRNAELRGILSPLNAVAERTNVAVVLVTHQNQSTGTNGKHRVTGSLTYVGACRANFLFVRDRDDPTGRRVLMLDNGCNLAGDRPTLVYRIADRGDGPAVAWEADPVSVTVEQARAAESEDRHERDERAACDQWLREMRAHGPVLQNESEDAGRDAAFSKDQLRRATERIGAQTVRERFGTGSKCLWKWSLSMSLPTADRSESDPS
jgi:putative DNA primase/helicase